MPRKVLIDGDPLCYRACFSPTTETLDGAIEAVDGYINDMMRILSFTKGASKTPEVFLTGPTNFRYEVATTHPYKGNRANKEKPEFLNEVKQHLVDNWNAVTSVGEEADDLLAIAATNYGPDSIVSSIDKDMLQIPCGVYNPTKNEFTEVSDFEGLKFFYTQMLTGDTADNIKGVFGVGPKKADLLLAEVKNESDMIEVIVEAYEKDLDYLEENGKLLWLRRYKDQMWELPNREDYLQDVTTPIED